jgi:predicted ribosome quality control (RQC) complex YloA/Tae2 family protein
VEGLFIAKILEELTLSLPARNLGWVFPDETTAALLLEPADRKLKSFNLVFAYRPPTPALYLNRDRLEGGATSAFQRSLEGKVRGPLLSVQQMKLDRVIELEFGPAKGFIEAPGVRLLFELTGRNANILLLEPHPISGGLVSGGLVSGGLAFEGKILQAAREIAGSRNRFRQVRSGGLYSPPPPYDKLDPRENQTELLTALENTSISSWHKKLDGLGPTLAREVAIRAEMPFEHVLSGMNLERGLAALRDVVANPSLSSQASLSDQARDRALEDKLFGLRKALREPLEKRLLLLNRQLEDVNRARSDAIAALESREHADSLLAYSRDVPSGASSVSLPNLYGEGEITIALEPTLDAAGNANKLYARAKRREDVLTKLEVREPELQTAKLELEKLLSNLETMPEKELENLVEASTAREDARAPVGIRYRTKGGFEVLVGRNSRENDFLTHRLAKSLDVWFHVQGYPGSHVILRAQNREVPFPDILEASALAAYHSKARGSSNVAVDYVLAKNVWRPKGARAGQVYFSGQKTVYVDGARPAIDLNP